jgi:hypothetical protein
LKEKTNEYSLNGWALIIFSWEESFGENITEFKVLKKFSISGFSLNIDNKWSFNESMINDVSG